MSNEISSLLNYGVLGLFAFIMIWVIWYQEKQRRNREVELLTRIAKLEQKVDSQQNEHDSFLKVEYVKATQVMEKCMDLLDEVKQMLRKNNSQNKNL